MRVAFRRAVLNCVALGTFAWSLTFYFRPDVALGLLGRVAIDPVIARQYPLYLISTALAYALAATRWDAIWDVVLPAPDRASGAASCWPWGGRSARPWR